MKLNQELIDRFYSGAATKAEIKLIAKYIYSDEIEEDLKIELQAEYLKQKAHPEYNSGENFSRIRAEIESARATRNRRTLKPGFQQVLKIAASIAIFMMVAYAIITSIQPIRKNLAGDVTDLPAFITKTTGKGQKLHLTLPDGSLAVLNANSQLTFPRDFSEATRNIQLAGEAYFDVVKDSLKPFIVDAGRIAVEVLGTSFNIKSGSVDQAEVALVEGSVKVKDTESGEQKLIEPGDLLIRQPDGFTTTNFDYEQTVAWKDGLLFFHRDNLDQILQKLENWYGVEFSTEGSRPEVYHYSGKFKNKSLEEVLKGISYVMMFDFEIIEDEKVIIKLNPENM